jgi:hypothetical protein
MAALLDTTQDENIKSAKKYFTTRSPGVVGVQERGLQTDTTAVAHTPVLAFISIFVSIEALSRMH